MLHTCAGCGYEIEWHPEDQATNNARNACSSAPVRCGNCKGTVWTKGAVAKCDWKDWVDQSNKGYKAEEYYYDQCNKERPPLPRPRAGPTAQNRLSWLWGDLPDK